MQTAQGEGSPTPKVGGAYAWYVLVVLFLVYVVNFVDRQIVSILAQDIKAGLGIGDAQIGILYGTVFGIFYSIFGIPLGFLVDRWYRFRLIALGLTVWSGMTVLSGLSISYAQLLGARVGVGIGEATASPAAYSVLGDFFPRERRALALSTYSAGLYVGSGVSLPLGGWIAHSWSRHYAGAAAPFGLAGWQAAFLAVGVPGLLLALWVSTLREPMRGLADGHPTAPAQPGAWSSFARELAAILPPLTLWSVSRYRGALRINLLALAGIAIVATVLATVTGDRLQWYPVGVGIYAVFSWVQKLRATDRPAYALIWGSPAVRYALAAVACLTFIMYTSFVWISPYVIRTFGVRADVAGLMLGVPGGLATAAGVIVGGRVSDLWRRRNVRGRIYVCIVAVLLAPPFLAAALGATDVRWVYVLAPLGAMVANMWLGSGAAAIQESVLPRMRGTAAATFFIATTAGLVVGPYFAGRVSALTGSLRVGMLSIFIVSPLAVFLLWRASHLLPLAEATKDERARAAGEPAP
jgi:MFS family permease